MNVRDRRVHRFRSSKRPRPSELRVAHIWEFSPAAAADPASHACDRSDGICFRPLSRTRAGFRGRDAAGYPPFLDPKKMISSKNNRRNLPRRKRIIRARETLLTFDSARLGKRQSYKAYYLNYTSSSRILAYIFILFFYLTISRETVNDVSLRERTCAPGPLFCAVIFRHREYLCARVSLDTRDVRGALLA